MPTSEVFLSHSYDSIRMFFPVPQYIVHFCYLVAAPYTLVRSWNSLFIIRLWIGTTLEIRNKKKEREKQMVEMQGSSGSRKTKPSCRLPLYNLEDSGTVGKMAPHPVKWLIIRIVNDWLFVIWANYWLHSQNTNGWLEKWPGLPAYGMGWSFRRQWLV